MTLWPLTIPSPLAGFEQRGQEADRGALAGAVRADEAEHLAGLDLQVQAIDGLEFAVVLCEVGEFDHGEAEGKDLKSQILQSLT